MIKKISENALSLWILLFSAGIITIGSIPIKLIILMFFIIGVLILLKDKETIIFKNKWSVFFLFLWSIIASFIGSINGFNKSLIDQDLSLFSTFIIVISVFLLYENDLLNIIKIQKIIYYTAFLGILIKVFLGFGILYGIVSPVVIQNTMQNIFGSKAFDIGLGWGFLGILPRIGDAGALFNIIVYFFYVKKYNGGSLFIWLLVFLFILVGYSRYLIACFSLITMYLVIVKIKGFKLNIKSILSFVVMSIVIFFIILNLDFSMLYDGFYERYMGTGQDISDSTRELQYIYLISYIKENYILGFGLGGYAWECIRSNNHLWQYELEYLALFMQLGVIGFLLVVINFVYYFLNRLLNNYDKKYKIPMLCSFLFWVITPFQSSLFIGTVSGLILITIYSLSRKIN